LLISELFEFVEKSALKQFVAQSLNKCIEFEKKRKNSQCTSTNVFRRSDLVSLDEIQKEKQKNHSVIKKKEKYKI
jgi:hypothetical protein